MSTCTICRGRLNQERSFDYAAPESDCQYCLGLFSTIGKQFTDAITSSGYEDIYDVSVCLKLCPSLTLRSILESRISPVTDFKEAVKIHLNSLINLEISPSPAPMPALKIDVELTMTPPSPALCKLRSARDVNDALLKSDDLEICSRLGLSTLPDGLANPADAKIEAKISINRDSLFLLGKYRKISREISQSVWLLPEVEYKPLSSVEEIALEFVTSYFQVAEPLSAKFSASGREDVDVRMLGTGRDFVLEISNLKKLRNFHKPIPDFNHPQSVEINSLRVVDNRVGLWLNHCAETHTKTYVCIVWSKCCITHCDLDRLSQLKNIVLKQWTPVRTLHRRPNIERKRTLHSISAEWISGNFFKLNLETAAGLYVKEFVHGDFGRTEPSLADLLEIPGNICDILQLDVLGIEDQSY